MPPPQLIGMGAGLTMGPFCWPTGGPKGVPEDWGGSWGADTTMGLSGVPGNGGGGNLGVWFKKGGGKGSVGVCGVLGRGWEDGDTTAAGGGFLPGRTGVEGEDMAEWLPR